MVTGLHYTIKVLLQKKSKHISTSAQEKNLSIQFSLDGFSFCITDLSFKIIHFTEYTFKGTLPTPELLLEKIEAIFSSDTNLQQDFKSVEVIHQNNLASLVPYEYFDEDNLKTYLDYTIKTLATDFIAFDDLPSLNAKNVYIPYVNVNNYLFQNFGEFEYKHHATILIDKLIGLSKEKIGKQFFVHVTNTQLDIIVIENKKLVLYNTFTFNTKEDFIYYILFVAEQLNLNPDEFQLTFLGTIEKDSENYKIAYNYVRNIGFIKTSLGFFIDSEDFSQHSNFILVS